MAKLENKVALVTGGASGLGKGMAERFKADGAKVVITDLQSDLGEAAASAGGLTFFKQDVTDEKQWGDIVGEIEKRFGRLDILVNSAGIAGPVGDLCKIALADWKKTMSVNLDSTLLGCRAVVPLMTKSGGGSVINLASISSFMPATTSATYAVSKAAVLHLTKCFAQYYAELKANIRCNSLHPGVVLTPLVRDAYKRMADQQGISLEEMIATSESRSPTGRFSTAEEIAAMAAFLVSDEAANITGAEFLVDGGIVNCRTYGRK